MSKQTQMFFDFDEDKNKLPYKSYFGFGENIPVKPYDGEVGSTVLPKWTTSKELNLDGDAIIRDHADVANIMRNLESKGVELAFAVHVNEANEPMIQFLGQGSKTGVVMDTSVIFAGAKVHDSKHVYLVHNHPSGNLTPSNADMDLTKRVAEALKFLDVDVQHVILNTYKEEYTLISNEAYQTFPRESNFRNETKYSTHSFDGQEILREPIKDKIRSSKEVAELVQQYRFSALPKHGLLVLANNHSVIANFLVYDFDFDTVMDKIAMIPIAKSVVAYGNTEQRKEINRLTKELKLLDYSLLDYIQVNSDANGVKGAYKSYADDSILGEVQEKYGTNTIKADNPRKMEMPWESNDNDTQNRTKGIGR